jgi:TonB family protein
VFTAGAMGHVQAVASYKPRVTPELAVGVSTVEPIAAPQSQVAPRKRPNVLVAQVQQAQNAETSPAMPNPGAADATTANATTANATTANATTANATPQDSGSISGTVEDPSGARVPQCLIVVQNQSGASEETTASDAAGRYRFSSLPPGHYSVEYRMRGFASLKKEAEIEAGKPSRIDARLSLGQTNETVTITGQKPATAPAAAAAQPASQPGPISVGGRVENARLLVYPRPVYPPELQQQGVEGTVLIRTVISRDGVPLNPQVLNTDEVDPRFAQAALDAVSQWLYQPAKLNEHPVANVTTITVYFQLGK